MSHATRPADDSLGEYDAIPQPFKEREKWLLWDASADTPRQPHWRGDFGISWSDPDDWHTFEAAVEASQERESWGIGYVFQPDDDEYLIDIDGPYDEHGNARKWFPGVDRFEDASAYIEWSPSGGLHIPVEGTPPEWWRDCEVDPDLHQGVDVLTNKFCTFTGNRLETAGDTVTDTNAAPFLFNCYQNIRGESPHFDTEETNGQEYNGDGWLSDDDVEAALDAIDPDLPHNEWIKLGYAVHAYDSGSTGKSIFEQWSKKGSKWDDDAKRSIDAIWSNASEGSGVTVATLVHEAKQAGWEVPSQDANPGDSDDISGLDNSDMTLTPDGVMKAAYRDTYGRLQRADDPEDNPTIHDLQNAEAATYVWDVMEATDRDDVIAVSNGELRAYDNGVWVPDGEQQLREYGRQALRSTYSSRVLEQLEEETRARKSVHHDDLGAPDGTIAVENGLLHLLERDGEQLEDLKREHQAIRRLNVAYDPDASPPDDWVQFLDESIRDDEDRKKFQEYWGYCLWHHAQPFGKALFLLGPTDSGKGTALKTLQRILGGENVANETLYDLMVGRWGPAGIYGKAVNIRNEVSPSGLKNVHRFKELTGGGDRITAEYKGQDKFEFTVTQKFLFATNEVPSIEHADEAFYNRCLFVKFPETVPEEEQNEQLVDELLEEKSGILNWMLEGLRRLMDQGHFTGERDTGGKKELCDAFGSVLERFAHRCLEVTGDSDDVVVKSDLESLATEYAERVDMQPRWSDQSGFTRSLKNHAPGIDDGQKRINGSKERVFTGVRVERKAHTDSDTEVRSRTGSEGGQTTL